MGVVAPPTTGFYRTTIISSVSYIRIHMNENKNRYNGEVRTTNCFVIDECLYICNLSLIQITISFHVSYIERIYTVEKGGKQYTDSEHNLKKNTNRTHRHTTHFYFWFSFRTVSVFLFGSNGHTGIRFLNNHSLARFIKIFFPFTTDRVSTFLWNTNFCHFIIFSLFVNIFSVFFSLSSSHMYIK